MIQAQIDGRNIVKIFLTLAVVSGDLEHPAAVIKIDTIKHDGRMWLVPGWIEGPTAGFLMPKRIVCLDRLRHQAMPKNHSADFVVNDPVPKTVLDGQRPPKAESRYVVIERPDIQNRSPGGLQ